MNKLVCALFALCLIATDCFAIRPEATANNPEKLEMITRRVKIRSEVRGNTINVMDINFQDGVSTRIMEYLKESGLTVNEISITDGITAQKGMKYDFIFWDAQSDEFLKMHIQNVFNAMRDDGIFFLRLFRVVEASEIEAMAAELGLDVKREQDVLVFKRKFNNYQLFQSVVKELAEIMAINRAA